MYALIHNDKIQVGPRTWSYSFFKSYLEEEGLDYSALTRTATEDNKIITDEWKIIPVTQIIEPGYDSPFEQLAGPYWDIQEEFITGTYDVVPNSLGMAQGIQKDKVTANRYKVEVGGCPFTFADGTEVSLYTTREDRSVYIEALQIIPDDDSIIFKFLNSIFKSVSKTELTSIVYTGAAHIQAAFVWEADKYAEIDACLNMDQLKLIDIKHPSQTESV
jgi:hypothetical protein